MSPRLPGKYHPVYNQDKGVDPVGGDLNPWKYVGGERVCFDPLKCQFLYYAAAP